MTHRRTSSLHLRGHLVRAVLSCLVGAVLVLHLGAIPAGAQMFGKNKVHYKDFEWSVIHTDHFEVYFYEGERETAMDAARMAERSYARLSRILGHNIGHKVPLILYASHSDFQQTNITAGLIDEGTGGLTEFYKQRVTVPFTGSYGELNHVLTHELVHAFQVDILYGDGGGIVANPFAFQPPLWMMEGMAEYLSLGGVDPHTRMWMRDASLEGYLTPIPVLNNVYDIRVYRFGQSVMDYIGRHYGDEKLGEILRRTPELRSVDRAIEGAIGVDGQRLSELWTQEMRKTYLPEIANHQKPADFASPITHHGRDLSRMNLAPEISPRGDRLVYISDRSLYQDIYLASAIDGQDLGRLVKGERTGDLETLRFFSTSLTWSPDEKHLAFVAKSGAEDMIYVFDLEKKKVVRRLSFDLDGLLSPSWSPDGKTLAFVGLEGGQSDLFLCDVDGGGLRRLTQDRYMARHPRWSPDGRRIAFTTDRGEDTDFENLRFAEPRVAIYYLSEDRIEVLPGQEGKNLNPCWSPDGKWLAFISDRTGISNIFATELSTGDVYMLTDVLTGVTGLTAGSPALSWSSGGDRMAFCAYSNGGYDVYTLKNPLEEKVPYQGQLAAVEPPGEAELYGPVPEEASPVEENVSSGDELPAEEADTTDVAVATPALPEEEPATTPEGEGGAVEAEETGSPQPGTIVELAESPPPRPVDEILEDLGEETATALPDTSEFEVTPYHTRFTRDFAAGGAAFASNVGFAGNTALGFSDILGNHQVYIAASVFGSLTDSDLLVSYTNLSRRTNYGVALFQYRDDFLVFTSEGDEFESRIYRGVQLAFSRPFSKFTRVEWSLQAAAVSEKVYRVWYSGAPTTVEPRGTRYFVSPSAALVRDNVIYGFNGPLSGTRSRLEVSRAWGDLSSITGILDYRKYVNIRQRYVLAFRGIGAVSRSRDKELFRVGGPFTFRGVDYGELAGTRVGLTNLEFRFPMIDRLQIAWPLALDFRGIQGVFFVDTAAAWDEGLRIWKDGHLADLKMAYGFGARLNLGIIMLRYDIAKATDLGGSGETLSFFTLGYDF